MKAGHLVFLMLMFSLMAISVVTFEKTSEVQAVIGEKDKSSNGIPEPCSLVLEPVDKKLKNAKGVALVYKVQLNPPSFARMNISILAVHLPAPSSYGDYDSYE